MPGKTVVIIQTRMGSTRLPGKSLLEIGGKPLIWHVAERAGKARAAGKVVLATTKERSDDGIAAFAKKSGIECFRGSTEDVLDRFYQCAKKHKAEFVVRITGDSPLVDPEIIDEAVKLLKTGKYGYVSNSKPPWMDGFDVEAFTFSALEGAWKAARMASEREHVTPYMRNSGKFRVHYLKNDTRLDGVQCSVDRKEDLEFVREIYRKMIAAGKDHDFTCLEVISLLEREPELRKINATSVVNEGYFKSLKEDKKVR